MGLDSHREKSLSPLVQSKKTSALHEFEKSDLMQSYYADQEKRKQEKAKKLEQRKRTAKVSTDDSSQADDSSHADDSSQADDSLPSSDFCSEHL